MKFGNTPGGGGPAGPSSNARSWAGVRASGEDAMICSCEEFSEILCKARPRGSR